MEEVILFYNILEDQAREALEAFCRKQGVRPVFVENEQYDVPVGFVAYGSDSQQADYLRKEAGPGFEDTMMVMAGLPRKRVFEVLEDMKATALPRICYKAMLTEFNAVWTSLQLHQQLEEERRGFEEAKKMQTP